LQAAERYAAQPRAALTIVAEHTGPTRDARRLKQPVSAPRLETRLELGRPSPSRRHRGAKGEHLSPRTSANSCCP